jgi:hypothetical protein
MLQILAFDHELREQSPGIGHLAAFHIGYIGMAAKTLKGLRWRALTTRSRKQRICTGRMNKPTPPHPAHPTPLYPTTTRAANRLASRAVNRDNNYSVKPLRNLNSDLLQQLERRTAKDESTQ